MKEQKSEENVGFYVSGPLHDIFGQIPLAERPGLTRLGTEWWEEEHQPLKGKRVHLNCHLTAITLQIIDVLLASGAQVSFSATDPLVVHPGLSEALQRANIPFYRKIDDFPEEHRNDYYDVVIDCGAGLLNPTSPDNQIIPKTGYVELTHTPETQVPRPLIDVDSAILKIIETFYGTGDGFARAITEHWRQQVVKNTNCSASEIEAVLKARFEQSQFVVVGAGKVGNGIVDALIKRGVPQESITIVDTASSALTKAKFFHRDLKTGQECQTITLDLNSEESKEEVLRCMQAANVVVTATGCKDALSWLNVDQFDLTTVTLANMGTHNEYGDGFPPSSLLNNGKPVNFSLEAPTLVRYLSPIFVGLLRAARELITRNGRDKDGQPLKNKRYPLPSEVDCAIIADWELDIRQATTEPHRTVDLVNSRTITEILKRRHRRSASPDSSLRSSCHDIAVSGSAGTDTSANGSPTDDVISDDDAFSGSAETESSLDSSPTNDVIPDDVAFLGSAAIDPSASCSPIDGIPTSNSPTVDTTDDSQNGTQKPDQITPQETSQPDQTPEYLSTSPVPPADVRGARSLASSTPSSPSSHLPPTIIDEHITRSTPVSPQSESLESQGLFRVSGASNRSNGGRQRRGTKRPLADTSGESTKRHSPHPADSRTSFPYPR